PLAREQKKKLAAAKKKAQKPVAATGSDLWEEAFGSHPQSEVDKMGLGNLNHTLNAGFIGWTLEAGQKPGKINYTAVAATNAEQGNNGQDKDKQVAETVKDEADEPQGPTTAELRRIDKQNGINEANGTNGAKGHYTRRVTAHQWRTKGLGA